MKIKYLKLSKNELLFGFSMGFDEHHFTKC